ncbi:predicted protein [Histoplasma capsulatum G186AR]|uniref:Uncharacterized protein n=1 Tax=Ajellomyces capsulatus (strain G186AR / H82 / ATCC MYA-2454 / RMSCC 2432) TaxID=447093 RepID=C0NRB5_AJECG|nr:uncharacterized protein HCBG_05545 [Histoplasma capsulatum G186AR]EEH06229.1 predicted protein [Histoplasma capsulatum G186AR]
MTAIDSSEGERKTHRASRKPCYRTAKTTSSASVQAGIEQGVLFCFACQFRLGCCRPPLYAWLGQRREIVAHYVSEKAVLLTFKLLNSQQDARPDHHAFL